MEDGSGSASVGGMLEERAVDWGESDDEGEVVVSGIVGVWEEGKGEERVALFGILLLKRAVDGVVEGRWMWWKSGVGGTKCRLRLGDKLVGPSSLSC
jgi:hypothetical protein